MSQHNIIERRFKYFISVTDNILEDKEFKCLYETFKNDKNKKTYNKLKYFLNEKVKKYKVNISIVDDDNNFIFNSDKKNTFERYLDHKIKSSNISMEQNIEIANKIGASSTYLKIPDGSETTIFQYYAK